MKWVRILAVVAVILVLFLLMCFLPVMEDQVSGIENYSPADSTLGLSANLFPDENFPERFEYTAGDYQFYFNGRICHGYSTVLSVLQYTPEQYCYAKQYCLEQFTLTDEHKFQIGNYTFVEHLCYVSKDEEGKYVPACQYPKIFNMFAYNDSNNTLLFLGYYNDSTSDQLATMHFDAFYAEHFSQYYTLEQ